MIHDAPGAIHPIVQTHEETHRKVLYLEERVGLHSRIRARKERRLLDQLWLYAALPANVAAEVAAR